MYAVIRTGGKQYIVEPGSRVTVEKLSGEKDTEIKLNDLLLLAEDGKDPVIGKPVLEGAEVTCKVIAQGKSKKVIVFKHKRRKRYMRKKGHRQQLTMIEISSIKYADQEWKA